MYVSISLHYDFSLSVLCGHPVCLTGYSRKKKLRASEENIRQRGLSDILVSDNRSSKDSNRLGYYAVSNDTKLPSFRKVTLLAENIDLTYTI